MIHDPPVPNATTSKGCHSYCRFTYEDSSQVAFPSKTGILHSFPRDVLRGVVFLVCTKSHSGLALAVAGTSANPPYDSSRRRSGWGTFCQGLCRCWGQLRLSSSTIRSSPQNSGLLSLLLPLYPQLFLLL